MGEQGSVWGHTQGLELEAKGLLPFPFPRHHGSPLDSQKQRIK